MRRPYSSSGALEDTWAFSTDNFVSLNEQQFVDLTGSWAQTTVPQESATLLPETFLLVQNRIRGFCRVEFINTNLFSNSVEFVTAYACRCHSFPVGLCALLFIQYTTSPPCLAQGLQVQRIIFSHGVMTPALKSVGPGPWQMLVDLIWVCHCHCHCPFVKRNLCKMPSMFTEIFNFGCQGDVHGSLDTSCIVGGLALVTSVNQIFRRDSLCWFQAATPAPRMSMYLSNVSDGNFAAAILFFESCLRGVGCCCQFHHIRVHSSPLVCSPRCHWLYPPSCEEFGLVNTGLSNPKQEIRFSSSKQLTRSSISRLSREPRGQSSKRAVATNQSQVNFCSWSDGAGLGCDLPTRSTFSRHGALAGLDGFAHVARRSREFVTVAQTLGYTFCRLSSETAARKSPSSSSCCWLWCSSSNAAENFASLHPICFQCAHRAVQQVLSDPQRPRSCALHNWLRLCLP